MSDNISSNYLNYFDKVWSNIQHNENIRNRLFQFYLGITGIFLAIFGEIGISKLSNETLLFSSLFLWFIGFSFLWAYQRIIEMISRDNKIVSHFREQLIRGSNIETNILDEYNEYNNKFGTTSVNWWSISSCIKLTTSSIAAVILTVGINSYCTLKWSFIIVLIPSIVIINILLIRLMSFIVKSRKKSS